MPFRGKLGVTVMLALVAAGGCSRPPSECLLNWEHGMGYCSAGFIAHSRFAGDEKGIEPGAGWSVTVPPLLPISVAGIVCVAAIELEGGGGGTLTEAVTELLVQPAIVSGVRDETRHVVSEVSVDLTFSESWHDDDAFGGRINYESWLLGLRLGGPERYRPSYSFSGGWGWHRFRCDSRPTGRAEGPYLGAALQLFITHEVRVLVECRRHFFTTDILGDPPEDGAWQGIVGLTGSWYF